MASTIRLSLLYKMERIDVNEKIQLNTISEIAIELLTKTSRRTVTHFYVIKGITFRFSTFLFGFAAS